MSGRNFWNSYFLYLINKGKLTLEEPGGSLQTLRKPAIALVPILSKIYISLPRCYQRINPIPKLTFRCSNKHLFLRWVFNVSINPQSGGPPLPGCPRLLIQHTRSYPPYLEHHTLPVIRDCLLNVLAGSLHVWRQSSLSMTWGLAVVTWTHKTQI